MTYKITETNHETGETTTRNATPDEIAQFEADKLAFEQKAAEIAAKEAAKQAALAKLGLTAEELAAVLS